MNGKSKILNIILLLIIIVLITIIVFLVTSKPKMDIFYNNKKIDNYLKINVNEDINKFEVKASFLKKDISKKVKVNGKIINDKIGEYKIEFKLHKFIYNIRKVVYVDVIDSVKPEIVLEGKTKSDACSMDTYIEEGFKATDNYDGDITENVKIKQEGHSIIYSVSDSSGNETSVKRELQDKDVTAPVIKLKGKQTIYLKMNSEYEEPGYTVSDNCDKKIENVTISNKIDTSKAGYYEVTYKAIDSANNVSEIKRSIYVYDKNTAANINGGTKGVIYLTFDDGPSSYTPKILDTLKKYNIKATFFVTSSGKDSVIKREYNEGHTVALHTASHNYKTVYSSVSGYFKDLEKVQNRVYKITSYKSTIIRFPGGSSNTISKYYSKGIMTTLTSEVLKRGYHYFDWTISVEDAGSCAKKSTTSDKEKCVYNKFVKGLSKNKSNVILMHDIKQYTANKLDDMIKYALSQGYKFDKITMDTPQVHHGVNN